MRSYLRGRAASLASAAPPWPHSITAAASPSNLFPSLRQPESATLPRPHNISHYFTPLQRARPTYSPAVAAPTVAAPLTRRGGQQAPMHALRPRG